MPSSMRYFKQENKKLNEEIQVLKSKEIEKKKVFQNKAHNNVFRNVISSGYIKDINDLYIGSQSQKIQNDRVSGEVNEHNGEVISNSQQDNWIIFELRETQTIGSVEISGDITQNWKILLEGLLSLKFSNDGKVWEEIKNAKINKMIGKSKETLRINLPEKKQSKFLMIIGSKIPLSINYLKINESTSSISNSNYHKEEDLMNLKQYPSLAQSEIHNIGHDYIKSDKNSKDEPILFEDLMKLHKSKSIIEGDSYKISNSIFTREIKFTDYKLVGPSFFKNKEVLENLTEKDTQSGIYLGESKELIIAFDKVYEFNGLEIAALEWAEYLDGQQKPVIYSSEDGKSWKEIGSIPENFSAEIITVKLTSSKARYIKFFGASGYGISYLRIV